MSIAALKAKVYDSGGDQYLRVDNAYPGNEHASWTALPREVLGLGHSITFLQLNGCKQLRRLPLDLFDKLPRLGALHLDGCCRLDGPFPDPPSGGRLCIQVDYNSSAACIAWARGLERSVMGVRMKQTEQPQEYDALTGKLYTDW